MDAFNCYLGGNVEHDLSNCPPTSVLATAAFFITLKVTRTHDVLCPAKPTSRYSVLTWPKWAHCYWTIVHKLMKNVFALNSVHSGKKMDENMEGGFK